MRNINPLTSNKLYNIKLKKPPSSAAGISSIKSTLTHISKEMGTIRGLKTLSKLNQVDQIDCPGCAWPDPEKGKRSKLGEYCENGAKAIAEEGTIKKASPDFFKMYSVEELSKWSDYSLGKTGRLTHPMLLDNKKKHYKKIKWKKAFKLIANNLNNLKDPNESIFYTSGRSSNEAAFLYGVFAREFGTNNLPDCSNMCHESSGIALTETLGIGKGSVTLDDFPKADLVMVIGQNPGTNHPRMLSSLEKLKKNGGKIISINPLEEVGLKRFKNPQKINGYFGSGTELTDVYLKVKINQDIPLLKAIMKTLINRNNPNNKIIDEKFIREKTSGFNKFYNNIQKHNLEDLISISGVKVSEFNKAIKILEPAKKIIICWAMGLTQHKNGVDNIKECVNLLLLKGSIGKKGAGTCPVRGHSNVQGDRSVGIIHKTSPELSNALKKTFNFDSPKNEGYDTVHSIKAMYNRKAKIFVSLGGNFLSAASDTLYTAKALQNCDLTVSISTKLNRTHLVTGKKALILPTIGRTEIDKFKGKNRFVSVENSMGRVHISKGTLLPASKKLMSEPEIISKIAHHTLKNNSKIKWLKLGVNYDLIREKISKVFNDFKNYNEKVKDSGFYLPNNSRKGDFSKLKKKRAKFSVCKVPLHVIKDDEFLLMSIRSHDQFNTTIYGLNDRYRGIYNERRVVFMNKKDIKKFNLNSLDLIDIESLYNGKKRVAEKFHVVPYNIPSQNLACYFPEANVLVPINEFAFKSQTPISKSIRVKIKKHDLSQN